MTKFKKLFNRSAVAAAATGAIISGSAFAALPDGVESAFTTATADIATLGGLALAAIVAAMAFKYMRRAL